MAKKRKKYNKRRSYDELLNYYTNEIINRIVKYKEEKTSRSYKDYERNKALLEKRIRTQLDVEYKNLPEEVTRNKFRTAFYTQFQGYVNISKKKANGTAENLLDYLNNDYEIDTNEWNIEIEEEMRFKEELQGWVNSIILPNKRYSLKKAIGNIIYNNDPAYIVLQNIIDKYFPEGTSVVRIFYA